VEGRALSLAQKPTPSGCGWPQGPGYPADGGHLAISQVIQRKYQGGGWLLGVGAGGGGRGERGGRVIGAVRD